MPILAMVAFSCDPAESSTDAPAPEITGISTDYDGKVVSGAPVTVHGVNFSPVASENKVLYGEGFETTSLRVTESSETHLVFTAPKLPDGQIMIRVSTNGKESNSVALEYENALSDADAISVSTILKKGTTKKIREGIEWTYFHGVWEGQMRLINIVKTTLNEHNRLGLYFDFYSDGDRNIVSKCEYLDAIVGTNGPMGCCHFVRVDGEVKKGPVEQGEIFNCALTIDDDAVDIVQVKDNFAAAALPNKTVGFAGPLLVYDSKVYDYGKLNDTEAFLYTTHPRTAIGISKDKKTVWQVTVDGRWTSDKADQRAIGMETWVLGKLMKGLGCDRAMNFDGGGGTVMWVYEQGRGGIVNRPSDSGSWDDMYLRPTGCAVYIVSDLK